MKDFSYYTKPLDGGAELHILIAGFNTSTPTAVMDKFVEEIVKGKPYSEFVDKHMDNPYIRVIITDINKFDFNE